MAAGSASDEVKLKSVGIDVFVAGCTLAMTTAWGDIRGFIAGYASGLALVCAGHPFDTIIVRMTSEGIGGRFGGPLDCLRQTVQQEGILAVYKGVLPPLLMTGVVNSVLFGMQASIVTRIKAPGQAATVSDTMRAAVVSGGLISVLVAPMERIKARLQVQYSGSGGVAACAKQLVGDNGLRQGLYRGWAATAFCRMSNYAYFGSYAYISKRVNPSGQPSMFASVTSGGLAGVCYWCSCYPAVVIKNRMQASGGVTGAGEASSQLRSCARSILKADGVRGFFVGFTPCVLRAMPANAAAFTAFEIAMRVLPEELELPA